MRLKPKRPESQLRVGLLGDQRGATMVMGVFVAVLLVGMIYYVWGIGDAIAHRERMQDASDTAAFSAAVIHARGMNMLALLNMIMAALATVAAIMNVIAEMILTAAIVSSAVCAGCGPWCGYCCDVCEDAASHWSDYSDARDLADDTEDTVTSLLDGMHAYAEGIRTGVPLAAQAKVAQYGADVYAPVTDYGVMAPPHRVELPVRDDETEWPCEEKMLTNVRIGSTAMVGAFATWDQWLAIGVGVGYLRADPLTREWCEDGYFQRIEDDADEMGTDPYQVQAYMIGSPDFEWTQTGVAIATWGEGEEAGSSYSDLAEMGRVSFAQAEFFYDDDESDYREWLWHMNWRARLRRWRQSAAGTGFSEICGSDCGALGSVGSLDSVVVH